MMFDLKNSIEELADNDEDAADFAIDIFGLNINDIQDKKAFGKKISTYLLGMYFSNEINNTTMSTENLQQQLRKAIVTQLDLCHSADTPTVCQMCSDAEGKEDVIKLVIDLVVKSKMEITEAIVAVEKNFNPNEID